MNTTRKRYRPLEIGEEKEIGLADVFSIDTLDDEKSYCFSWPDAPLSVTMAPMYLGNDSKVIPVSSNATFPKILRAESSELDISSDFSSLRENLNKKVVISLHKRVEYPICIDSVPKDCLSPEESIFSLTDEQLRDARRIGLFSPEVAETDGDKTLVRLMIEAEIIQLEWRAYREAKHTASALQRLLSLEAAVPLVPSSKVWKKMVYSLWIFWRTNSLKSTSSSNQRWGSSLLPGSFLYGIHNDYFLNSGATREEVGSHGLLRYKKPSLVSRRRTVYNFLCWKVERFTAFPRRRHQQNCRAHSPLHPFSTLTTSDVENRVSQVLSEPFERIEFDESRFSINSLECPDLKEEVQTWKKWLGKV